MKLNRLILAAFAALAVFACNKPEPEKEPEPKDTTPAELKSFALLKADNAAILTEDVTVETIAPTMVEGGSAACNVLPPEYACRHQLPPEPGGHG